MAEPKKPESKEAREARLAEALRANLRKRKAQARERGAKNSGGPATPTRLEGESSASAKPPRPPQGGGKQEH